MWGQVLSVQRHPGPTAAAETRIFLQKMSDKAVGCSDEKKLRNRAARVSTAPRPDLWLREGVTQEAVGPGDKME